MDVKEIEQSTIGQRDNPLWYEYRKGRITASAVGPIIRRKQLDGEFIKQCMDPKDISGIPAIQWGVRNEEKARSDYIIKSGNNVRETGLFISADEPNLAASPDGIIFDGETYGVLELKCPYSIRFTTPQNGFKKLAFTDNDGKLKQTHNYFYQIQLQLYTTRLEWAHFVIWTPYGISIEKILWNEELWREKILPKLTIAQQLYIKSCHQSI